MGPFGVNLSVKQLAESVQEDGAALHGNYSSTESESAQDHYERQLQAARDSFPGWDVHEVHGGLLAVPEGTAVITAIEPDTLVMRLREHEG